MAGNVIVIERELLRSEAFRSLSGTAKTVYFDFRMKITGTHTKPRQGRQKEFIITNNGKIEYCYSEAEKKGISRPVFVRALRELVEHGLIDREHAGSGGIKGDKSLYAISERWRAWGSDKFKERTMTKDTRGGRGFSVYWQRRRNANIGNVSITQAGNIGVTP
jgi:hypothetical protein